ncbi:hypothetical protein ACFVYG_44435 [Streptomyces sp. NPDC058256]|uniref:hypothetical protein n=1 Tax=Streptomyces sp. NPDC058256 TaxID=3346408 RepID=UPI0036E3D8FA
MLRPTPAPGRSAIRLAECLWWVFVLANRLDVDMREAYATTMDRIDADLQQTLRGTGA